jgi:phage-related protein
MEKITFTSSAGSMEFSADFPYKLISVAGVGELPWNTQTDEAYGIDGNAYYDTLASARLIKLNFWFNATTHAGLHTVQRLIQSILNPKLGEGEIILENDNEKYRITAAVFDGPIILPSAADRLPLHQHAEVAFICCQPFWESYIEYSQVLEGSTGGLEFPLAFPISFAQLADNVVMDNIGDVDTPLRFEFRGPATGCKIEKVETGEYVEVTYTLQAGEKLVIDTNPVLPSVTFIDMSGVETSAFNKINALSTFFQLTPGINTFAFTAATGTPDVYMFWRYRYVGV